MQDYQIPFLIQHVMDIALVMRPFNICRKKIIAYSIMAFSYEGIPNGAGIFTSD